MNNEWISVGERLPSKDGCYLVFNGRSFDVQSWNKHGWLNLFDAVFITHWMPIPDAPKDSL